LGICDNGARRTRYQGNALVAAGRAAAAHRTRSSQPTVLPPLIARLSGNIAVSVAQITA